MPRDGPVIVSMAPRSREAFSIEASNRVRADSLLLAFPFPNRASAVRAIGNLTL
jgi:hypothetical protein